MAKFVFALCALSLMFAGNFSNGEQRSSFEDWLAENPAACPRLARILCYAHHYPPFNGAPIECDKPIMCGDKHLFERDVAPLGIECEWDPENPSVPTKVCNGEGKCSKFFRMGGDC